MGSCPVLVGAGVKVLVNGFSFSSDESIVVCPVDGERVTIGDNVTGELVVG